MSHFVKLSVKLHPFDWHREVKAHMAPLEIGYMVLSPCSFVDILAGAGAPVAADTWGGVADAGLVNLIDTRDVADAARVALLDFAHPKSQRAYHLTGPGAVSMPEVAGELSKLLGRIINYERRTPAQHRDVLIASGVSELVADLLLGLDRLFYESVLAETTSTFTKLTGKAARSVANWLSENNALFKK